MGRLQAFDTDQVVRAARAVFWAHGYEDASLPDLERATGLSRSSIYHAFGSKRGLFDATVRSYLDEVVRPSLATLTCDDVAPDAIVGYLTRLRDALGRAGSAPADNGCLLVNAAAAPIGHDEAVRRTVAAYRAELRAALGAGIDARWPARSQDERDRLAQAGAGLVVAAFVLVRIDPQAATATIGSALELLGEPSSRSGEG